MRIWLHLRRMALALAVLCPAAGVRAQDVFIRVPVDLGGMATRMTLPFNEPFLLVGAAPERLTAVKVRYVTFRDRVPSRESCTDILSDKPRQPFHETLGWTRNRQVKADSYAVVVDSTRANQRYGFCIGTRMTIDSTAQSRFQSRAFEVLDSAYASLVDSLTGKPLRRFSQVDLDSLQRHLARSLPRDQGEIQVKNTLFDTTSTTKVNENLLFTAGVIAAQTNRSLAAEDLDSVRVLARKGLDALAANATLRAVAGRTASVRVSGVDSAMVQRAVQTARAIAFPSAAVLEGATGGEVVLGSTALLSTEPREFQARTDSAYLASRISRLDSTYTRLAELRDLAAALGASEGLQRRVGVRAAGVAGLRTRLDGVLGSFQQAREHVARWATMDAQRRALLMGAARSLRVVVNDSVPIIGTSISSFDTRAKQYVTADLGVVYLPWIGEVAPYFGANFYLGALNKRVPLSVARPREWERWSLTAGVTARSLARKDVREDLFGSYSLLLGAGRRMTDPVRLTGGAVVYRRLDVNPLLDHKTIAFSPFLSLSFDFDAKAALGKLGDTLFP